jgi:hypothetical protein
LSSTSFVKNMREIVENALQSLFMFEERVHVRKTNRTEETASILSGMTRMLADAPFRDPVTR